MKIAANIVTYNRESLLLQCIKGLINQTRKLDCIYIIDNQSTDETFRSLTNNGFINQNLMRDDYEYYSQIKIDVKNSYSIMITYIRLFENTGSSGGQYEGIINAAKDGYDWVWLMDDDVEPQISALENMITSFNIYNRQEIACIVPKRIYENGDIVIGHEKILVNKYFSKTIFREPDNEFIERMTLEGPLVRVDEAVKASYDLSKYFILYDDVDLAYKLSRGNKILFDKSAVMIKKIRIPLSLYTVGNEWKQYYRYRNFLLFAKNNFSKKYIIPIILHYIKEVIYIMHSRKFKYFSVLVFAIWDIIVGKSGKTFTPDNHPWK